MQLETVDFKTLSRNVYIRTFGCQMNVYDSENILRILENHAYSSTDDINNADLILLNTCSIREKPEHKVYSTLGRLKRLKDKNPKLIIGVGGCVAQQEGERLLERVSYLDIVFGTHNIHSLPKLIEKVKKTNTRVCETTLYDTDTVFKACSIPSKQKVNSFVTIMQGCNNYCSYCIVPYVRGKEMSRESEDILKEVNGLSQMGVKEVTLLGQNVNSYGKGLVNEIKFCHLLHSINTIKGIQRIRFTTSHPKDLSDELIRSFGKLNKLCEQIHLPVQSGSNSILQEMNRGYTVEDYIEKVEKLKRVCPGISITSDIIVGFPGETEKDFEKTLELMRIVEFDGLFSFKYSDRGVTKASSLPEKVDDSIKSRRLHILQTYQKLFTLAKNKELEGKEQEVLVEGTSKTNSERLTGRTRSNRVVNFEGDSGIVGRIIPIRIMKAYLNSLEGEII
ncbi:MAG: tRNA (N6-isopentenyl adenosine(37)-C2)-methylthiotransferase MiaB [Thermodesulfobacteriota bacterium]|nr:tRNA (N6-isopentenyl adenosine(37)-C2)-methylthiotransferase MiaB [Thermodesulfobacteriota bacterium]